MQTENKISTLKMMNGNEAVARGAFEAGVKVASGFPGTPSTEVMDSTAFSLCLDNGVPILVFDIDGDHAIRRAVQGEKVGTIVHN